MWDIMTAGVGASATDGRLFATSGCAMTCHTPNDMYPDNGRTDLWHWKTSRSNPLGYVNDQYTDAVLPGRITDAGETIESRNRPAGGNNTSGPRYVWDPTKVNQIVRGDGAVFNLDPQLFLAATATMPIEGDAIAGNALYQSKCQFCHNADGLGLGKKLAVYGLNQTRDVIVNKFNANGVTHGGGNLAVTDTTEQKNLVARIRAFAGAPGYTVQDVTAPSDAVYIENAATVYSGGTYTVIIKRKLVTLKPTEDVQFTDLAAEYPFSVAIMDYDGKNHAGGALQKLIFRP
jgi:mono/diheme cytochrome c family protein